MRALNGTLACYVCYVEGGTEAVEEKKEEEESAETEPDGNQEPTHVSRKA